MAEDKLLQRRRRALADGKLPAYELAVTALADHYANAGAYRKALAVYTEAAAAFGKHATAAHATADDRMRSGRAHRMIGEMHMLLDEYAAAGAHMERHLRCAQRDDNAVEEQRAHATIGRLHLLHGQSMSSGPPMWKCVADRRQAAEMAAVLRRAEASFQRSLAVCRRMSSADAAAIGRLERIDMQARLYLNLGVTYECLGDLDETEAHMERALQLCRDHNLYELLHQCYGATASFLFNRRADTTKALRLLSLALAVATERLEKRRQCETLIGRADIFIRSADFQSARQTLHRAYRLRTPVETDRRLIEQQLRTVVAISQAEDRLVTTASDDYATRRALFELLGDGASQLRNFEKALDYYAHMLASAEKSFVSERELVPCYVSMYQTYMDLGRFDEALVYLRKEYALVQDTPAEAISTLMNIADALNHASTTGTDAHVAASAASSSSSGSSASGNFWAIDEVLQQARQHAAKLATRKLEQRIVQRMVRLRRKHKMWTLVEVLREEAAAAGIILRATDDDERDADNEEDDDDGTDSGAEATQKNTLDIGADIDLDELSGSEADDDGIGDKTLTPKKSSAATDSNGRTVATANANVDDSSSCSTGLRRRARRTAGAGIVKRNEKGETALHQGCIAGNVLQVRRLLDAAHPVNVRDFAGWMPLHEAANHGHVEVVRLLLERGAWINDRGGKMCDGVTALHDACGNGCLEVVEVLLDAGANATMRTDLCETPVDTLEKWHRAQNNDIDADEQALYERLRGRLLEQLERTGVTRTAQQATPSKPSITQQSGVSTIRPSTSSLVKRFDETSSLRRRCRQSSSSSVESDERPSRTPTRLRTIDTMLADEFCTQRPTTPMLSLSEDDASRSPPSAAPVYNASGTVSGDDACTDYRNVMAALRKPITTPLKRSDADGALRMPKRRAAGMLGEQEVGESWLEIDIEPNATAKKAKVLTLGGSSNYGGGTSKAGRYVPREQRRSKENDCPSQLTQLSGSSSASSSCFMGFSGSLTANDEASPLDAFDVMMNPSNKVSSSTVVRQRQSNKSSTGSTSARQTNSLLHAGFVQFRRTASFSNAHVIDVDVAAGENEVSSTRIELESHTGAATEVPVTPKLLASGTTFKVRVNEQLLNVPVNNDMIADLTIGWLAEEASRRYYNLKGLQPVLEITSSDGAAFETSDPLSVVLGMTIGSNVLEWILPSVVQRYMESCRQFQTVPDDHIKSTLELIQATHQLKLADQPPLRTDLCRPLCRAIHHQANIAVIDLSRVCLEDDGIRHLVEALCTIRPKTLKLSGNHITALGLQHLTRKLTHANSAPDATGFFADLQVLDLSYNPLGDAGAAELHTLLAHCPALQTLALSSTGLRQLDGVAGAIAAAPTADRSNSSFACGRLLALTELDVGYNRFSAGALRKMLSQLNACKLIALRLGFCCDAHEERRSGPDARAADVKALVEFLQSGTLDALRVLDVSGWRLDDSDMYELVHTLRRAPQLDAVRAVENGKLGAIGFAQLVRNLHVKHLYLDGCGGVVRNLAAEMRPAVEKPAAIACVRVRLPKFSAAETEVLREFWTNLHGVRAIVGSTKSATMLELQQDH